MKRVFIIGILAGTVLFSNKAKAQNEKVVFNGYSRAFQQANTLTSADSVNADKESDGHTLIDLGVGLYPDRNTQIKAVLRFKTELGGFYGSSASAELRQLYVKGVLGKVLTYELGDIYVEMSPYTLYNNDGDGQVNEASIFNTFRTDYAQYENLNKGNTWWQQGGHVDFGLQFKDSPIKTIKVDGLFNRISGGSPSRFQSGGRIVIDQSDKLRLTGHYISLFDMGATAIDAAAMSNPVFSGKLDYLLANDGMNVTFEAEAGSSQLNYQNDDMAPTGITGGFADAGLKLHLKKSGLKAKVGYRRTDPKFYSAGAQTKRINFAGTPEVLKSVANNPFNFRNINVFDLTQNYGMYNQKITEQLMSYDPRLGNAMPYGLATPNRQGLYLNTCYKDSLGKYRAFLDVNMLSEVAGEYTTAKRSYMNIRVGGDLAVNQFIGFEKKINLKAGVQIESTSRSASGFDVNLSSSMIDAGLDINVAKKLDLLLGAKILSASGNEFIASRDIYNELSTTAPTSTDINNGETIIGYGAKYNFSKKAYLTLQQQLFSYKDNDNSDNNYDFNQFVILFNLSM